jgi:signal transduction histidine kinase
MRGRTTPCEDCPVARTFADGKSHQSELSYRTPAGGDCHLFAWTTPLREPGGEVGAVMLMATDISPILDMRDHLSSLGLMIGSVSHSIKGLLTGLDGGVYMLDKGFAKADSDQIGEGLDIVKMMVGRIKNMVLDVLYYAKERELALETCRIADFVKETVDVVAPRMSAAGIDLVCDVAEDLQAAEFQVDPDQLRAALVNILDNAVDACRENADRSDPQIVFRSRRAECDVIFAIEDNGVGMSEAVQSQIFTLFFSSKATQGTGIGLFITRKIIRQHGGEIEVSSRPGEGTCFQIRIPLESPGRTSS